MYTHAHTGAHIHTCTYTCIHVCMYTCTHSYACIYPHAYIHARMHICTCMHTHMYKHTCTHSYMRIHTLHKQFLKKNLFFPETSLKFCIVNPPCPTPFLLFLGMARSLVHRRLIITAHKCVQKNCTAPSHGT